MTGKTSHDGTGRGLVKFLEYAADKGLMNKNTSAAQRSAATKVLGIDGERWEDSDIRTLDVDQQILRFKNLKKGDYSPQSLQTYDSRFRTALAEYFRYLDDPGAYRPNTTRESRAKSLPKEPGQPSPRARRPQQEERRPESTVAPPARDHLVTYPFPLRDTMMAYLQLPNDLTDREAQRICKFVQSLALEASSNEETPS